MYHAGVLKNMVIIEVNIPSGYELQKESVIYTYPNFIQKIEFQDQNTKLIVYLSEVSSLNYPSN